MNKFLEIPLERADDDDFRLALIGLNSLRFVLANTSASTSSVLLGCFDYWYVLITGAKFRLDCSCGPGGENGSLI